MKNFKKMSFVFVLAMMASGCFTQIYGMESFCDPIIGTPVKPPFEIPFESRLETSLEIPKLSRIHESFLPDKSEWSWLTESSVVKTLAIPIKGTWGLIKRHPWKTTGAVLTLGGIVGAYRYFFGGFVKLNGQVQNVKGGVNQAQNGMNDASQFANQNLINTNIANQQADKNGDLINDVKGLANKLQDDGKKLEENVGKIFTDLYSQSKNIFNQEKRFGDNSVKELREIQQHLNKLSTNGQTQVLDNQITQFGQNMANNFALLDGKKK